MKVEVVHALPDDQRLVTLELPPGSRAADAVRASGLIEAFPGIDPERTPLGIFGRPCGPDRVLRPGDRVEIHRPLEVDPKEARRLRAGRSARRGRG